MPMPTALVLLANHQCPVCWTPTEQNKVEVERDVQWCPKCEKYTDGTAGFHLGDPKRDPKSYPHRWSKQSVAA